MMSTATSSSIRNSWPWQHIHCWAFSHTHCSIQIKYDHATPQVLTSGTNRKTNEPDMANSAYMMLCALYMARVVSHENICKHKYHMCHKSMHKHIFYIFHSPFLLICCSFFHLSLVLQWLLWHSFHHRVFTAVIAVFWWCLQYNQQQRQLAAMTMWCPVLHWCKLYTWTHSVSTRVSYRSATLTYVQLIQEGLAVASIARDVVV